MLVIGFDPGSNSFGVGILEKEKDSIRYVYSEEIKLKDAGFYARMQVLWQRLDEIFNRFSIHSAAIEEGFLGKNVKAMNVVAKVRGVVLGSLLAHGIPLTDYSPRQVKQALTGSGGASKEQVGRMVQILLNMKQQKLGNDESDALAVAYCHLLQAKPRRLIQ